MPLDPATLAEIRAALDRAGAATAANALPELRRAAEQLAELIDDSLAEAVLTDGDSLRAAGARAGLSENAVGPRLARTSALAPYANAHGRVTASAVERARYDRETGRPRVASTTPKPMRFTPRRSTS
ncbi:MAG TPA: hypothetical protein IAA98_06775 [Candidatus Avipropionibacterium avicola]|uniref:Uncharacterized protein n=1 Tax=Candidatus Avipropionibacterium avicola TaxID=2840701 RepID=A0A9D1GXL1_9ACTN|nr:hypothetical protein [Candidatus Avipropionibacterium avicola]